MLESHNSSFHIKKRTAKIMVTATAKDQKKAPLDKALKAIQLQSNIQNTVRLLKLLTKENRDGQNNAAEYLTDLNKHVFKCVLGFARAIDKHSLH